MPLRHFLVQVAESIRRQGCNIPLQILRQRARRAMAAPALHIGPACGNRRPLGSVPAVCIARPRDSRRRTRKVAEIAFGGEGAHLAPGHRRVAATVQEEDGLFLTGESVDAHIEEPVREVAAHSLAASFGAHVYYFYRLLRRCPYLPQAYQPPPVPLLRSRVSCSASLPRMPRTVDGNLPFNALWYVSTVGVALPSNVLAPWSDASIMAASRPL